MKHMKFLMILFISGIFVSCGLLRKKNRCNDCPKWGYQIDNDINQNHKKS